MICTERSTNGLGQYKNYGKHRDVGRSYKENYYSFMVVKLRVECKSSDQPPLKRLTLKRIRTVELEEEDIDLALEESKAQAEGQLMMVESAPQESRVIAVPPKKRRYVEPPADETSAKNISSVEEEQVLNKRVVVEKPHQPKAMTFNESEKEQQEQQQKQQQPKAALPQSSNAASSSKTIHAPCQDGACAGTSASGFLLSTSKVPDHGVWLETLKKNFDQLESSKILQDSKLTEKQSEILQRSFMQVCEKMSYVKINSYRFLKIHNCLKCEFTISHQCLPFDYIRSVPFGTQLMRPGTIVPNRTVICICGFAFFHAHFKRDRAPPVVENTFTWFTDHLREIDRSVNVRCHKCHIKVVMTNRSKNVCCGLTKWEDMTGANRQSFYDAVQSSLHYPAPDAPSLDEFSACSNNCCLFFHRCSRKADDFMGPYENRYEHQ